MPLYPYRCTQCGHRFEKIQSFNAPPETVCPKCGGVLERPLTAPGLQFKGAGWYVNDYSRSGSSSSDSSSAEGKASGDGKAATESKSSGESKTASGESKSASGDSGGSSTSSAPATKSDAAKS